MDPAASRITASLVVVLVVGVLIVPITVKATEGSGGHLNPFVEDPILTRDETLVYHIENDGDERFAISSRGGPFIITAENGTPVKDCEPPHLAVFPSSPFFYLEPGERWTLRWNQTFNVCSNASSPNWALVPPGVYTVYYAGVVGSEVTFTITGQLPEQADGDDRESSAGTSRTLDWSITGLSMIGSVVIAVTLLRTQRRY